MTLSGNWPSRLRLARKRQCLGVYSIVDLSGFNLGSNNFNFYSAEIHLTWTFSPFKVDRLILSGGIYNRQLPMIISRGGDQFDVDTAEQLGYHAGLNYWRPFSKIMEFKSWAVSIKEYRVEKLLLDQNQIQSFPYWVEFWEVIDFRIVGWDLSAINIAKTT